MNYLHNILKRNKNDLISRVFEAQSGSPLEGDFVKLVMKDFELINEKMDKKLILSMTKTQFKKWVKNKIKKAALIFLNQENNEKSKTKQIIYKDLKLQNYLKSKLFSNYEVETLIKLRSNNRSEIKF